MQSFQCSRKLESELVSTEEISTTRNMHDVTNIADTAMLEEN